MSLKINDSNDSSVLLELGNTGLRNLRCELISGEDVSFLEGKLKTLADAVIPSIVGGDDNKQNKAIKDIIRTILWDWFNFITDHNTDHLMDKKKWYQENKK